MYGCVCMYGCMSVWEYMYECMYGWMYMHGCMNLCIDAWMYGCMHGRMDACMVHVCIWVDVCIGMVCMYV